MPQFLKATILIVSATLLLCFLAFYNGFPLLYPDTGTYIRSGFTGQIPIDRPIFYGMFIRHVSLAQSLWLVIFAQSAILAWLLYKTIQRFVSENRIAWYYLGTICILLFTTSLAYFANVLIPDIFTSITFLCAFHLAFFDQLKWPSRIAVSLIFIFALITHLSHFPTIFLMGIAAAAIGFLRRKRIEIPFQRKSIFVLMGITLFAFIFVPTFNAAKDGHFRMSAGSSVFFTNRLRDLDLVKDFLDKNCATNEWKLCPHKDNLYGDFLWDVERSPLYMTGGWEANIEEYGRMNRSILSNPKFLARFVQAATEDCVRSLFSFSAGPVRPWPEESAPVANVKEFYPRSLRAYLASKQIHDQIDLKNSNSRQELFVIGSMAFLLLLALDRKRYRNLPANLQWFLLGLVLFSISNAAVCASLSNADNRYQGRIIWLFPFAVLLIATFYAERYDLPKRMIGMIKGR